LLNSSSIFVRWLMDAVPIRQWQRRGVSEEVEQMATRAG
jgi:hypothetical protein